MITLDDMSLAELYGMMLIDMSKNPQLSNCVLSVVEESEDIQVIPYMRIIQNDKYSVEFAISDKNTMDVFYCVDTCEQGTLPMYDSKGKEVTQLQIVWNLDSLKRNFL